VDCCIPSARRPLIELAPGDAVFLGRAERLSAHANCSGV
jgi:hypothetical protein